ncbi:MAG: hypothetical protein JO205_05350 [Pseudolabrys sp.]|nr:hypothetical protein [Pseudolabrys sp.]
MAKRLSYRDRLCAILTPAERRLLARLDTPKKIQDYLDAIPINFELDGDTHMSPRRMLKERKAHCTEGALFAAACLMLHGERAYLMDLRALAADQDHVIALFRAGQCWGAISKTNHPVLRWRDPIYRSPRELAMSYAHEYYLRSGRMSLIAYSRPFSLARYAPARWVTADDDLDWLVLALDNSRHLPLAPRRALASRRRASPLERRTTEFTDWPDPRQRPNAPSKR